jgi:hypothetical protein
LNDVAEIRAWPLPNTDQNSYCQLSSDRCPVKDLANVNPQIMRSTVEMAREVIFALSGSSEEYAFHTYRPQ